MHTFWINRCTVQKPFPLIFPVCYSGQLAPFRINLKRFRTSTAAGMLKGWNKISNKGRYRPLIYLFILFIYLFCCCCSCPCLPQQTQPCVWGGSGQHHSLDTHSHTQVFKQSRCGRLISWTGNKAQPHVLLNPSQAVGGILLSQLEKQAKRDNAMPAPWVTRAKHTHKANYRAQVVHKNRLNLSWPFWCRTNCFCCHMYFFFDHLWNVAAKKNKNKKCKAIHQLCLTAFLFRVMNLHIPHQPQEHVCS